MLLKECGHVCLASFSSYLGSPHHHQRNTSSIFHGSSPCAKICDYHLPSSCEAHSDASEQEFCGPITLLLDFLISTNRTTLSFIYFPSCFMKTLYILVATRSTDFSMREMYLDG
jgi:hypothetical protein